VEFHSFFMPSFSFLAAVESAWFLFLHTKKSFSCDTSFCASPKHHTFACSLSVSVFVAFHIFVTFESLHVLRTLFSLRLTFFSGALFGKKHIKSNLKKRTFPGFIFSYESAIRTFATFFFVAQIS
jgi:hypothetical protein